MDKEVHSCLGCGRTTTSRCQICWHCLRIGKWREKDSPNSFGPWEELVSECEHNYSENALGPHTSDERDYRFVGD